MSGKNTAFELIKPLTLDFVDNPDGSDDALVLPVGTRGVLRPEIAFEGKMLAHFDELFIYYIHLEEGGYKVLPESALSIKDRANNAFGDRMWHSLYTLQDPFKAETRCYCCAETAVERVIVNIWGSVCEFDMCVEHVERYANKCVDMVTYYEDKKCS